MWVFGYLYVTYDEYLFYSLIFDYINAESRAIVSPFFRPPPGQGYEKINAIKGNVRFYNIKYLEFKKSLKIKAPNVLWLL